MTALAAMQNITMLYGGTTALDHVSLSIRQGSYTVLLGPSGSGKTTLLSILGGFLEPTSGTVTLKGADCTHMSPAKRPTATVFQDYALFPHLTVGDNVGFGLRMRRIAKGPRDEMSRAMLATVGLPDAFNKKPYQLSGGQRQRVALARSLVVEPQLLLLDEPLGALDLKLRRQMQDELKALQQRVGTAFVHVTHDQEEAMALADHIVVMNQGRIEDQGPPEQVYARPATRFSAAFMGESTIIKEHGKTIAIRPEHLTITAKGGNLGEAKVLTVTFQGSFKRVFAQSLSDASITFIIRCDAAKAIHANDVISLAVEQHHMIMLRETA
jgi:spermidine/putrescine transport system ATP-binding protein